jgi:hypothetical protein
MKKALPLLSALFLAIAVAAWADCGPFTGQYTVISSGGCISGQCQSEQVSVTQGGCNQNSGDCSAGSAQAPNQYAAGGCSVVSDCSVSSGGAQVPVNTSGPCNPN